MIISNKIELQRFLKDMKLFIKCKKNPHSFLVNDTTLPPDNRLSFRQNLLENIMIMTTDGKFKDEKSTVRYL